MGRGGEGSCCRREGRGSVLPQVRPAGLCPALQPCLSSCRGGLLTAACFFSL